MNRATPAGLPPVLRSHRIRVGLYHLVGDTLTRTDLVELDLVGERTEVPELAGREPADLLLINDDDLTFAKIRLGVRSLATVVAHLGDLDRPMARALVWSAAWDMTRDAEIATGEYLELAFSGLPTEKDVGVVSKVLLQMRTAIDLYAAPDHRESYRRRLATFTTAALLRAAPGSDHQLAYARAAIALATSDGELDVVRGLLDGTRSIDGLSIDTDMRWSLLGRLVATGRADGEAVGAELERDDTASGRRSATAVLAAIPTEEAKEKAWDTAVYDDDLPNSLLAATLSGLAHPEQRALYRPYRDRYFEVIRDVWDNRSSEMAGMLAAGLYPSLLVEQETVDRTDEFLASTTLPHGLHRVIAEARDGVQRALRCQARDAGRDTDRGE